MTTFQLPGRHGAETSSESRRTPALGRAKRPAAALGATLLIAASMSGGPLVAITSAQSSSVLQQSAGSGMSAPVQERAAKPAGGSGKSEKSFDVPPDFTAPGVDKGFVLVGWAKALAMLVGVLALMGGVVANKALQSNGNHHAAGVRTSVMGICGAVFIAGLAPTLVPWLMG